MLFRSLLKRLILFGGLFFWIFGLYPSLGFAQSAWLSNHFMANNIERLPDDTFAITEYPIVSTLSGPGPYRFASYTQMITARGKHKIKMQILQDTSKKIYQVNNYTVDADYDGYIDEHICHWNYTCEESGWYKMEIFLDKGSDTPELIGTFYFYVNHKK